MIRRGEVVAIETLVDGGEFITVKAAELVDGDPRAQAICLGATNSLPEADDDGNFGRLNVVTSGQCPALVLGPCSAGDSLCLAAGTTDKAQWATTGKYLKKGAGCFAAIVDVAAGDAPVMVWVRVIGVSGGVQRFLFDSEENDYLWCYPYDGDTVGSELVSVAKPYLLRLAPFDGLTRNGITYDYSDVNTRDATDADDNTQTEVITPSYQSGEDEIWAVRVDVGGTGVVDSDGKDVVWLEQDQGRAWAKQ